MRAFRCFQAFTSLDGYHNRGLVVDEDFERGISPVARAMRTMILVLIAACIAAASVLFTSLHPLVPSNTLKSRARPTHAQRLHSRQNA